MFAFVSSARLFSRRSNFSSRGGQSKLLEAVICTVTASTIGSIILLKDDNDIENSVSSVLSLLPITRETRTESNESDKSDGFNKNRCEDELFHGQCLKRQMHIPTVPYPLWDYNWDGRMTSETSLEGFRTGQANASSTEQKGRDGSYKGSSSNDKGKTRHIILVRHGQYDERREEDEYRKLTPLGRQQAIKTGKRLVEIAKGSVNFEKNRFNGKCVVKAIHVSNMVRAKETAALIAKQFHSQKIVVQKPDPLLNEALPAPMVPIRPDIPGATEEIDQNHDRIEEAFQKYFKRDDKNGDSKVNIPFWTRKQDEDDVNDDFEIIVCHGNVIRYLFCRALQLPPEAWLRLCTFNCSITYLVIRPNGMVSARMMGDIGHLDYDESTFSGKHGFKW
jgi:serine/threonine-protein phosphatase PGAM5